MLAVPHGPWFTAVMGLSRRRFLSFAAIGSLGAGRGGAQESTVARLGILLDTSAEMGFLVPQVRKELRLLNGQLAASGRPPVVLREIAGSDLDREASTSVGARKNVLYGLKTLYEEVDTVLWITSLKGEQSPQGIFALETLLKESAEGRPPRQLILRHLWQDQAQAGDRWLTEPPGLQEDPLELKNRPEQWYRLLEEGRGNLLRSWQVPPPDFRRVFGFPWRVVHSAYLRRLGQEGGEALFDQGWSRNLTARHGLSFFREKEEWLPRITGRRWIEEVTLLPFPDEAAREERVKQVAETMFARETIEHDLSRIVSEKLGVVFAFGYVSQDWKRFQSVRQNPPRTWRDRYLGDLARIGSECSEYLSEAGRTPGRVHVTERIELASKGTRAEGPDPLLRAIARMAREESCEAVYLFTNGYLGGGEYGTWNLDLSLLALAIRESGTRLFVRVPFEFGPVPLTLQQLALASGGGVFTGTTFDPDWEMEAPPSAWPSAQEEG